MGSIQFDPWRRLWKSWSPRKCKPFLWLAIKNKCWTVECHAMRGRPHPVQCPLCDHEESIQHLLTSCVFAREFWCRVLAPLGMSLAAPSRDDLSFADWWRRVSHQTSKDHRKGIISLIILGAWSIWKHRNACVFQGTSARLCELVRSFKDHHLWCMAGAKGLGALGLGVAQIRS